MLQHTVLMNARFMSEGVGTDDRLVTRHLDAGELTHQTTGATQFAGFDP